MKGLSFSEPMVKAWLAGNKTVTRRLISNRLLEKYYAYDEWCNSVMPTDIPCSREYEKKYFMDRTPYRRGEIVFIGEAWRVERAWEGYGSGRGMTIEYRVDEKQININEIHLVPQRDEKWRSPITMPAWASRSKARIVSVMPERVQEITADDIRNEGTPNTPHDSNCLIAERQSFIDLWESLHPGSWDRNDWVWRIELRKEANHA